MGINVMKNQGRSHINAAIPWYKYIGNAHMNLCFFVHQRSRATRETAEWTVVPSCRSHRLPWVNEQLDKDIYNFFLNRTSLVGAVTFEPPYGKDLS